ncbi:MAG: hypothetical protein M3070_18960 [Actinomycetota bacterium]|nr:hypothetical protein [Actinomycetota bacterium]
MVKAIPGRQTAEIDGDFVVFLIGARLEPLHPLRLSRLAGEVEQRPDPPQARSRAGMKTGPPLGKVRPRPDLLISGGARPSRG